MTPTHLCLHSRGRCQIEQLHTQSYVVRNIQRVRWEDTFHPEIVALMLGEYTNGAAPDIEFQSRKSLSSEYRMQRTVFSAASQIYDQMKPTWKGQREFLLAQLIQLVERFIDSDNIRVDPPLFNQDQLRRRIVLTLNMAKIVQHMWEEIRFENALTLEPVLR